MIDVGMQQEAFFIPMCSCVELTFNLLTVSNTITVKKPDIKMCLQAVSILVSSMTTEPSGGQQRIPVMSATAWWV